MQKFYRTVDDWLLQIIGTHFVFYNHIYSNNNNIILFLDAHISTKFEKLMWSIVLDVPSEMKIILSLLAMKWAEEKWVSVNNSGLKVVKLSLTQDKLEPEWSKQ